MFNQRQHKTFFLTFFFLMPSVLLPSFLFGTGNEPEYRPNLLLITLDTTRTDRLSCYDMTHSSTPHIDGLAEQGTLFLRAFAHSTMTLPSHANILVGGSPLFHSVRDNAIFGLDESYLTLAEHLKSFGYSTGAFIASLPLDSRFGLDQGFDVYDDALPLSSEQPNTIAEIDADEVVAKSLAWVRHQKKTWFLWVHLFDPHYPYAPPEPFHSRYPGRPYDGEVAYMDFALGKLFTYLSGRHFMEETVIIITGDHGESLGDHGEMSHGFVAYNSTLWIPLIIFDPRGKPGRTHQPASHVDIFPTICELLGVDKPPSLQGISLVPALKGKKLPERPIYFESMYPHFSRGWAPLYGFISENLKYIESPIPELYDLGEDFNENHNLADERDLNVFRQEMLEVTQSLANPASKSRESILDRELVAKMASLGYISGAKAIPKAKYSPRDDAKVLLPLYNKTQSAWELYHSGQADRAMEMLKEVITERHEMDIAHSRLANIYRARGAWREALQILTAARLALPESYEIYATYVDHLIAAGQYGKVIEAARDEQPEAVEYDPEIWNYYGIAYMHGGEPTQAARYFQKSLSLNPKNPSVYNNLGVLYYRLFAQSKEPGHHRKSIESFNQALAIDPGHERALGGLAAALIQGGDLEEAVSVLEKAHVKNPESADILYNLGIAYFKAGHFAKALEKLDRYHRLYAANLSADELAELVRKINICRAEIKNS